MIGKAPATGSGFKGLISYLMKGKVGDANPHRVAWVKARNLLVDDPAMVTRIMRSTARQSRRCAKPVYHLVVSWHQDESPSDELMQEVGDATLVDLNLDDHQALMVAHADTEHRHLHIVVNRVHPDTGVAWDRWQDWPRIERSLARQARTYGLPFVPGRHTAPEMFRARPRRARGPEYRAAERTGASKPFDRTWSKSQVRERRPALAETMASVRGWDELERALAVDGMRLRRKGQGLVIDDGEGCIKLSDVGRSIRLGSLEERFGEDFEAFDERRLERERLEELSREGRMAVLQRRVPSTSGSTATEGAGEPITPAFRSAPVIKAPKQDPSDAAAYAAHAQAQAEVDLAYSLYRAGIISKKQLEHSLRGLEQAGEALDATRTVEQRMMRDLARPFASPSSRAPSRRRRKRRTKSRGMEK